MEDIINKAIEFTTRKHEGQLNQGNPFLPHPLFVFDVVKKVEPRNINLQIAALLHDTLEDTFTSPREIEKNFNENIASLVIELTDAPTQKKKLGKAEYLKQKCQTISNDALIVKLADRLTHAMLPYSIKFEEAMKYPELIKKAKQHNEYTKFAIKNLAEVRELNETQLWLIKEIFTYCEKF